MAATLLLGALTAPSRPSEALSLAVGLLQVVLACVVARDLLRFGRRFPWLVALSVFFALRGVDRVYVAFSDRENPTVSLVSDGVVVLILLLLILRIEATVRGLRRAEEDADWNRDEYERALSDYRALVRHRLANPLTVLRGGIETLAGRSTELDGERRDELVEALRAELERLETTTLDPVTDRPEEYSLEPAPRRRSD